MSNISYKTPRSKPIQFEGIAMKTAGGENGTELGKLINLKE